MASYDDVPVFAQGKGDCPFTQSVKGLGKEISDERANVGISHNGPDSTGAAQLAKFQARLARTRELQGRLASV
jgi:hypothetical protein